MDSDALRRRVAVIIATGVNYGLLGVPALNTLVGSGVFDGAAVSEAPAMTGRTVFGIGGGNSTGQAGVGPVRPDRIVAGPDHSWWPWQLTPLTSRAVGAWLISLAVAACHALIDDDVARIHPLGATATVLGILEIVALLRYGGELDWSSPTAFVHLAVLVAMRHLGRCARAARSGQERMPELTRTSRTSATSSSVASSKGPRTRRESIRPRSCATALARIAP